LTEKVITLIAKKKAFYERKKYLRESFHTNSKKNIIFESKKVLRESIFSVTIYFLTCNKDTILHTRPDLIRSSDALKADSH